MGVRVCHNGFSGAASTIVLSLRLDVVQVCYPAHSGLVSSIVVACTGHHKLGRRVQVVLAQFSCHVQAHVKQFRDRFVDFERKRSLGIVAELCN